MDSRACILWGLAASEGQKSLLWLLEFHPVCGLLFSMLLHLRKFHRKLCLWYLQFFQYFFFFLAVVNTLESHKIFFLMHLQNGLNELCMLSRFSRVRLFVTPWTVVRQAPPSMGILQARILEWVVTSSCRESSRLRD